MLPFYVVMAIAEVDIWGGLEVWSSSGEGATKKEVARRSAIIKVKNMINNYCLQWLWFEMAGF